MACYPFGQVHADMVCLSCLHTRVIFVSFATVTASLENSAARVSTCGKLMYSATFHQRYIFGQDLSLATPPICT